MDIILKSRNELPNLRDALILEVCYDTPPIKNIVLTLLQRQKELECEKKEREAVKEAKEVEEATKVAKEVKERERLKVSYNPLSPTERCSNLLQRQREFECERRAREFEHERREREAERERRERDAEQDRREREAERDRRDREAANGANEIEEAARGTRTGREEQPADSARMTQQKSWWRSTCGSLRHCLPLITSRG